MGIDINGASLQTLLFADDQILIARNELMELWNNLKVNVTKTKYVENNGDTTDLQADR